MDKFNLETSINYNIARIAMLLKRKVTQIIADYDLSITPDQWVILYYLWEHEKMTIGNLSKVTRKDYANITRIVDKLVNLGYVRKEKSTEDNRITYVEALSKSHEIKNAVESCWIASTEISMRDIGEDEQNMILDLLRRIEQNII
ncbi:MarR family transcriptional regulator [Halosquirtibacter xylanolyticus]|uniref:MarR family winged helix-turn-helix transcriptional regulator n=1 Tax=Halosquirtibacter xylanolyticus TaxID=3374599 RepID=UPI0037480E7E|nr:MarR family transcriptional regulator [Prolixibacteraceae bacterium]